MHSNNLLLCCLIFMLCLPVGWSNLMFSRRSYRFLPDKSIHFKNMTFTKLRSSVKHNFKYQFLKLKSSLATFRQKISEPQTKTNFENILKADNTGINIKVSPGIENSSENPPDAPSPTAPLNRPIQERYDLEALKNKAQQYLTAVQWDPAGTGNNIDVFRAKVPLTNNKEELKWPCFKTRSIVNCSVSRLYNSLMDTENIMQYSEWLSSRGEVEREGNSTIIAWSRAKSVLNMKPHDFCTLSHTMQVDNHTTMVLMYGVEHPDVPPLKNHSRSNIIFSVNVLKDVTPIISFVEGQSEPKLPLPPQTELITISHVAYTGVYPFLINQRAVSGILDYLGALDSFASRGEDATGDDYPL